MTKAKYQNPFSATLNGIIDLFRKQVPIGDLKPDDRLDGKTCLVTGANSGLGYAIAVQLIERGGFVYLACRSQQEETQRKLKELFNESQFEVLALDLADFNSIQALADEIKKRGKLLDVAVFNAAMVPSGSKKLASGFDEMFQVNYLSKFYLINYLIQAKMFAENGPDPARIVFISSESHRTNRAIDFEKLGQFEEYSMSKVIDLYGYYKLVLNTFAVELGRRLRSEKRLIDVFAMCPGPVNSNIARRAPGWVQPILKLVFSTFFSSPEKAAKPAIFLASSSQIKGRDNLYLHLMQDKSMDIKALDEESGMRLWNRSEDLMKPLKLLPLK